MASFIEPSLEVLASAEMPAMILVWCCLTGCVTLPEKTLLCAPPPAFPRTLAAVAFPH